MQNFIVLTKYSVVLLVLIFLAGCSSNQRFASSFSKRRYNRGYFNNAPGSMPTVASRVVDISGLFTPGKELKTPSQNLIKDIYHSSVLIESKRKEKQSKSMLTTHYSLLTTHFLSTTSHSSLITNMYPNDPNYRKPERSDAGRQGFFIELAGIALFFLFNLLTSIPTIGSLAAIAGVLMFITGFIFCLLSFRYTYDYHGLAWAGIIMAIATVVLLIVFK